MTGEIIIGPRWDNGHNNGNPVLVPWGKAMQNRDVLLYELYSFQQKYVFPTNLIDFMKIIFLVTNQRVGMGCGV